MADQPPYCIHCGAQQLNADSKFCYRCGQPIVPVKPGRPKTAPWLAPVLVSAAIVLVAVVVLARVLSVGPAASETAALTPAPPAAAGAATPARAGQAPIAQAAPTVTPAPLMPETPTPPTLTETPQPTPTLANITPESVRLTHLAWSLDGRLLAVGSATGVYLYDMATWQEARFIPLEIGGGPSPEYGVTSLVFSFDGTLIATEGHRPQVRRVADGGFMYELGGQAPLAASPTEGLWVTHNGYGDSASRLQLRRTSDGQLVREIPIGTRYGGLHEVIFSSDGQLIGVAAEIIEGFVVLRVSDGEVISKAHESSQWLMLFVSDLAFRPGDSTMAVTGTGDLLGLWDARSGMLIRRLAGVTDYLPGAEVMGVSYAPDGAVFATLYTSGPDRKTGTVQLWSADGTRGRSWPLSGQPSDIAFSPDSRLLAVLTGQSVLLYNPSDGSMARQVEPIWRQGILPTPTPTPLHVGLKVPADWKEQLDLENRLRVWYPPYWTYAGNGTDSISFVAGRLADFKPESSMILDLSIGGSCGFKLDDAEGSSLLDRLKRIDDESSFTVFALRGNGTRVLVSSGKWPSLIPALYAEFDTTLVNVESRVVREIRLLAAPAADHCVTAYLLDEPEDITDQTRLNLVRLVGSIEFEDSKNPFPTATPTYTPTPNPAPAPALPLQISFDAKTSRTASGGGGAEITIEIKDAFGNPVNEAEVTFSCGWGCRSVGLSRDGRYTTSYGSTSDDDRTIEVEVRWNQELIAQEDYVISWQ